MIWGETPGWDGMGHSTQNGGGSDTEGSLGHEPEVVLSTCTSIFPMSSYHSSGKGGPPFHRLGNWAGMR